MPDKIITMGPAPRVSTKMRTVIEEMATKGASLLTGCETVGMTLGAAQRALRKPHVVAALKQRIAEIRDNAGQRAHLRLIDMAQETEPGRLKYDVNRWVAGVDGISPVQKVVGSVSHQIRFGGFIIDNEEHADDHPSSAIEGEAVEIID